MPNNKSAKSAFQHALQQSYDECANSRGRTLLYQFPSALKWIGKGRASKELYIWSKDIVHENAVESESLAAWINEWISRDPESSLDVQTLHDAVLLAQLTPFLPEYMDIETWGQLVTHLLGYMSLVNDLHPKESPVAFAIAAAELPIVLHRYHRSISDYLAVNHAMKNMIVSLEEALGDDGLPHANMFPDFQETLASWTRMYFACQNAPDVPSCPDDIELLFQQCARNSLSLSRDDHEILCTHERSMPGWKRLRELAVTLVGETSDKRLLCTRQPNSASRVRTYSKYALPEMSFQSDWSECAVARSSWDLGTTGIYVIYSESIQIEMEGANGLIISSLGEPRVSLEGEAESSILNRISDWSCTSWFNDHEAVYMEFESRFSNDVTVQRQLVMAKDEAVILTADAVISDSDHTLSYSCEVELSDRLQMFEAEEHSEGFVVGLEPEVLVLPMGLDEWRGSDLKGSLRKSDKGFVHSIRSQDGALYAPLLFCLSRDAGTEPYTWRQLSVAEGLSRTPDSIAVGYRAQFNESQWLIYRSLAPPASRSILGQNTTAEFIFGAVDDKGEFHQYVGVEGMISN